jgi:hypothetical protein
MPFEMPEVCSCLLLLEDLKITLALFYFMVCRYKSCHLFENEVDTKKDQKNERESRATGMN